MKVHASVLCRALLATALLSACGSDGPTDPEADPLRGLRGATASDSAGTTTVTQDTARATPGPLPDSLTAGPGYFHGVVRGSGGTTGPDTLATSLRIKDVQVVAYPWRADGSLGPAAATTTTNERGEWQLATVPGGAYKVTFTPPVSSPYAGVWVTATAHPHSHDWPWWVTLPRR
jgi:hypothetical protein